MSLISVELAHHRQQKWRDEVEQDRRAYALRRVVVARKAQRRAEQAAFRARRALASV